MKLLFFDIETTGVKFWKNGIHQISGQIIIDEFYQESFDFKVCPVEGCIFEKEALEVGNVTIEQIKAYPPMKEVYLQIIEMLSKYVDKFDKKDKFFLVGYNNASFDNQFLRAWFVQNGDKYFGSWFWSSSIDIMVLASQKLMNERPEMENFQLKTVAKQLGIEIDESKLHDASYDIELTKDIYYKLILN